MDTVSDSHIRIDAMHQVKDQRRDTQGTSANYKSFFDFIE